VGQPATRIDSGGREHRLNAGVQQRLVSARPQPPQPDLRWGGGRQQPQLPACCTRSRCWMLKGPLRTSGTLRSLGASAPATAGCSRSAAGCAHALPLAGGQEGRLGSRGVRHSGLCALCPRGALAYTGVSPIVAPGRIHAHQKRFGLDVTGLSAWFEIPLARRTGDRACLGNFGLSVSLRDSSSHALPHSLGRGFHGCRIA
jgi:hypothetical protein